MPLVNHAKQEINAKIVYFGPAGGGKGTNLHCIYKKLKKDCRGKMKTMDLQNDRMLFFDFVPPGQNVSEGYQVRFHIYTLIGKVSSSSSWKMLLKGVDGVIFVADSDPARMPDNLQALTQLKDLLHSMNSKTIPLVMQYNKRDAENPVTVEEMDRQLNPNREMSIPAVAIRNDGVLDSLSRVIRMIMNSLQGGVANEENPGSPIVSEDSAPAQTEVHSEVALLPSSARASIRVGEATSSRSIVTIPLTVAVNGVEKKITITVALDEE